ncbi:adenosylcobinamide amidohydrolase [Thermaerobacillus caldiproteolyticus]|uniref:Iron complex transport system ATP-binding protein n=1 Tax=Thermaerobacillus caldiproteolyticus TaxID=247480 RepID=A0A7V9Z3A5_9BACL|nr:adenosylcobinamide amidohydrolase [Anoxybacillus caldiproteolyticus]MBA2873272.1 iron complex transport system ATP-binding protein [Anoxybacillus caldiproteolyticus]
MNVLEVNNVSYRYHDKMVLQDVTFTVQKGELFGILGPNGSGKTTLLKLLSKELSLQTGMIFLNGKPLVSFSQKELARLVAVLPQSVDTTFGYTVKETVELGRYAHQGSLFPKWTEGDEQAVIKAIEQVELLDKMEEGIDQLSGGERQRAYLARALAQEPDILLLDEPTNHMDIAQQMKLLDRLSKWTKEKRLTVIAIFHDMNLASLYCDRILFLKQGSVIGVSEPNDMIEESTLRNVFGAPVRRQAHPVVPNPIVTFLPEMELPEREKELRDRLTIEKSHERIVVTTSQPFKVLSSSLVGAGFQWATHFVNRHVSKDYRCDDAEEEMKQYLRSHTLDVKRTIGMMTAVCLEDAAYVYRKEETFSLFTIVTAGIGNAVDAAKAWERDESAKGVGTINIIVFIDGTLMDAAYVQAMMTATEAKTKALYDERILDPKTNTMATGTSTDCIAIAASQMNTVFDYAGTITPLGKAIGRSVYEATREALRRYQQRRGDDQ